MFWVSLWYKKIYIKFILKRTKNTERINQINSIFDSQKTLKKNIFGNSPLYLTMKSYLNNIYFSFVINLLFFLLFYLFFIICASYFLGSSIGLVAKGAITVEETIFCFILCILFMIRYNSDSIKIGLDCNLLNRWKYPIFIVDILTLNLISTFAYSKSKVIVENQYMRQNITVNQHNLKNYQKTNKSCLFLYALILGAVLMISVISFILGTLLNINTLKMISLIFLLSFLFSFSSIMAVLIPTIVITYFVLKQVDKNNGTLSLSTCLWLVRYIKSGIDKTVAAIFIDQLDIHEILLNHDFYKCT